MSAPKVTGLDLSMTSTGVAHTMGSEVAVYLIATRSKDGDRRLVDIGTRVVESAAGSELVLIEGYLNHSFTAGITGMVHGAVRAALIQARIPYATVPPSSLKKYATGRGGAKKTDMAVAAFKRAGREFADDNQCDAWWLWVMAQDYLGKPVFDLPKTHRDSLAKVKREVPHGTSSRQ